MPKRAISRELLDRRRFKTQAETRLAVFSFIEGFYNPRRRPSSIGNLSPIVECTERVWRRSSRTSHCRRHLRPSPSRGARRPRGSGGRTQWTCLSLNTNVRVSTKPGQLHIYVSMLAPSRRLPSHSVDPCCRHYDTTRPTWRKTSPQHEAQNSAYETELKYCRNDPLPSYSYRWLRSC
jgi:hypothetical protein